MVTVRKANSKPSKLLAATAQAIPITTEPDPNVAAAAVSAPSSMMPSIPRLSTPLRSTTSSPRAASSNGLAAATLVANMLTSTVVFMLDQPCQDACVTEIAAPGSGPPGQKE